MQNWVSVSERLPLSGPDDDKYNSPFHEKMFKVIIDGVETESAFWACWEEVRECEDENFIMEFDCDGVTHWLDNLASCS